MSVQKNINNFLNKSFNNHDYLPQKLLLEDLDEGALNYLNSLNIITTDENDSAIKVPIFFLTQERWAEFKINWQYLKDENGQEVTMPYMTLRRKAVKPGEHPLKRTIPNKKKFTFLKVPIFDGVFKGFDIYKVPQPPRVDIDYELRFFSHYMEDVNISYESMLAKGFSDGQGYTNINGYYIPMTLGTPSEENTVENIDGDRRFTIIYPISMNGKLVDTNNFEKVQAVTKVQINIQER